MPTDEDKKCSGDWTLDNFGSRSRLEFADPVSDDCVPIIIEGSVRCKFCDEVI